MDRFLHLIKKKMVGKATEEEEAELNRLVNNEEEWNKLYAIFFSKITHYERSGRLHAEQAYAAHYTRMQLGNQFF